MKNLLMNVAVACFLYLFLILSLFRFCVQHEHETESHQKLLCNIARAISMRKKFT